MVKIIKLNAIDSTNSYLISLSKKENLDVPTLVVAEEQIKGRGQLGASWQSKPLQSLTFSIYNKFTNLSSSSLFAINFAVSIAVYKALNKLMVPQLAIKWPNDIMSHSKKLAGILIENQLKDGLIVSTVIGIGLNVNEEKIEGLPNATSMLLETGKKFILEEVLTLLSEEIIQQLHLLENKNTSFFKTIYDSLLFKKNKISVFEDKHGIRFNGIIKGVTKMGELLVENEEDEILSFQLKEIKYLL